MNFPIPDINKFFETNKSLKGIFSIWGDYGIGKTTLALQTAINSSKQGKILFIYSKPNFPYEKLRNILPENLPENPINILNNISFISVLNFADLITITANLEFLILKQISEEQNSIKLLIIDSVTDLYRLEINRERKEKNVTLNYQLNQLLASLHYINETYNIDVLLVNEMSRKSYDDKTIEIQSGGKVMVYWVTNSIKISRTGQLNVRELLLTKHLEEIDSNCLSNLTSHGFE
ncbi:MAG: hypothetical protein ACTSQD_07665 [Promethearchaeota archaeon]